MSNCCGDCGASGMKPLQGELKHAADKYAKMLETLHTIHINRCLRHPLSLAGWEILCFVDASSHTMAACLYQRTLYTNGSITSTLICSKMRLVPVKKQESIPRAETQAGVIGVKLAFNLAVAYDLDMRKITFFSDSTTLLWWLRTNKPLTIFVANRICQILDRTTIEQWNHVSTQENPADIPTRGDSPAGLKDSTLWWEGPPFASLPRARWPDQPDIFSSAESEVEELSIKEIVTGLAFFTLESSKIVPSADRVAAIVGRTSSISKGLGVVTLVWEFLERILKLPVSMSRQAKNDWLELQLVAYDQGNTFKDLQGALASTGRVPNSLAHFRPFLGPQGEIRCETRLKGLASVGVEAKYPILMHGKSKLAEEILRNYHCKILNHCGGVNTLIAETGKRFMIIGVRRMARKICQTCPRCLRRTNPKNLETIQPPPSPQSGGSNHETLCGNRG